MSYAGTVDGPQVNVVCIHQHDNVAHYLVNGECELIEVSVKLVYICMVIVGRVGELHQSAKLHNHHHHEPVSREHNISMKAEGSPRQKSALYCGIYICWQPARPACYG